MPPRQSPPHLYPYQTPPPAYMNIEQHVYLVSGLNWPNYWLGVLVTWQSFSPFLIINKLLNSLPFLMGSEFQSAPPPPQILIVLSLPPNEKKPFLHLLDLYSVYLHIWLCMHLPVSLNIYMVADSEIESWRVLTRKNLNRLDISSSAAGQCLYFSCSWSKERRPSVRSLANNIE